MLESGRYLEYIKKSYNSTVKRQILDFPGGPVVKNPPANAGDMGFDPWSRKFPHAMGQLSLEATTTEPMCPEVCALQQEKPL